VLGWPPCATKHCGWHPTATSISTSPVAPRHSQRGEDITTSVELHYSCLACCELDLSPQNNLVGLSRHCVASIALPVITPPPCLPFTSPLPDASLPGQHAVIHRRDSLILTKTRKGLVHGPTPRMMKVG